jgi:hypothetical protein
MDDGLIPVDDPSKRAFQHGMHVYSRPPIQQKSSGFSDEKQSYDSQSPQQGYGFANRYDSGFGDQNQSFQPRADQPQGFGYVDQKYDYPYQPSQARGFGYADKKQESPYQPNQFRDSNFGSLYHSQAPRPTQSHNPDFWDEKETLGLLSNSPS